MNTEEILKKETMKAIQQLKETEKIIDDYLLITEKFLKEIEKQQENTK
ncbi:MAG: hypothetical protein H7836_04560 [Magnetococcus sp. YQC-3]